MARSLHHVIIGSGIAGSQAAETLRDRDPDSRVTIITLSPLLFYNRYDLPRVFRGVQDWRDFLVFPPSHYEERRIVVRRDSRVMSLDPLKRQLTLAHKEVIGYDTLLVATGGRGYLPESLAEFRPLMQGFGSFEQAVTVRRALPDGGRVVMLGGDMIGLDLARTLIDTGYQVTLVAGEYTFSPHQVSGEARAGFLKAVEAMGVAVVDESAVGGIAAVEQGAKGMPARRILFKDGSDCHGDVVMPFYGLVPSLEFMAKSGTDIERGLLVQPTLRTTDEHIYAAGDVCQIWSAEDRRYRFYYGWKNVRAMGAVAARNMLGAGEAFVSTQDETLRLDSDGRINSPFWEYH